MSETELNKGKLKPTGKTIEQYMEGVEIPDYYTDKAEAFEGMFYRKAYFLNGEIYEVECEDYDDGDDIFNASRNEDGSIDFLLKYYNGGRGFSEALDYAIKKLND